MPSAPRPAEPVDPNPKFRILESAEAVVPPPAPSSDVRTASYDEMDSAALPQPVDAEGHSFEFGNGVWDRWDLLPTVATLVSFSGNPGTNTQPIPANTTTSLPVRASRVFYRLAPGASQGSMSVRVYRWRRT